MEQMTFDFSQCVDETKTQQPQVNPNLVMYREIFKTAYATSFTNEMADNAVSRVLTAISLKSYKALRDLTWLHNKASRKVFELATGLSLPKTDGGTDLVLQEFCHESYLAYKGKREAEKKAKEDAERKAKQDKEDEMDRLLDGFLKGKPMMQRVNALDALTGGTRYRMSDGKVLTRQEAIRMWAAKGTLGVGTHEEDAVKFPRRWNSMTWDEQNEWERRHREAGKKTVYEVMDTSEEGFYEMGKTAYDYAVHMMKRNN